MDLFLSMPQYAALVHRTQPENREHREKFTHRKSIITKPQVGWLLEHSVMTCLGNMDKRSSKSILSFSSMFWWEVKLDTFSLMSFFCVVELLWTPSCILAWAIDRGDCDLWSNGENAGGIAGMSVTNSTDHGLTCVTLSKSGSSHVICK